MPMTLGVSAAEVAKFSVLQKQWWNATGPLRSLHLMNPIRVQYVDNAVRQYGKLSRDGVRCLAGCGLTPEHTVLDVGCGGGILSESLARLGGTVTGIDACEGSIAAAQQRKMRLIENSIAICDTSATSSWEKRLEYRCVSLFDIVRKEKKQYDVVVASEVIEHVSDARAFLQALCEATKPGGLLILSTMDKSLKTAISHILIAEYLTGVVKPGTHDWAKFIPPQDMTNFTRRFDVAKVDLQYIVTYPDIARSAATRNFQINFALSSSCNTGHYFWTGVKARHTAAPTANAGGAPTAASGAGEPMTTTTPN